MILIDLIEFRQGQRSKVMCAISLFALNQISQYLCFAQANSGDLDCVPVYFHCCLFNLSHLSNLSRGQGRGVSCLGVWKAHTGLADS